MPKIKKLSSDLINQIAAGEVVERPASVVKELVENSLDAQASFISVKIDQGGKSKITIQDNGEGMTKQNAKLAFQSHTTSKINSFDDLNKINSFGFRGEALASITSIAKVELKTKTTDQNQATRVFLENGKIKDITTCAHPQGTTIIIEDLFYNVPARQKFLKATQTEYRHIRNWLQAQALASPNVGFAFFHNGREIFHYPENQKLKSRLQSVLGDQVNDFIPIKAEKKYLKLNGLIAPPQKARKQRKNQYLFVNKRYVNNKTVMGAIKQAYQNILPHNLHPPFVLFLKIRPDLIDVNIHPRKEEIKFVSASMVFSTVKQTIQTNLNTTLTDQAPSFKQPTSGQKRSSFKYPKSRTKTPKVKEQQAYFNYLKTDFNQTEQIDTIAQIGNLYLVVPQNNHLWIIDQHAAEERILLEKFIKQYEKDLDQGTSQKLLFNQKMNLDQSDLETLKDQEDHLIKIGFKFEYNDQGEINIKAIPNVLKNKPIETILLGFLDDLGKKEFQQPKSIQLNPKTFHSLATLACRSAVKQGDKLIPEKRKQIVKQLKKLGGHGATCPHGRPTWIKISMHDFAKTFKRE